MVIVMGYSCVLCVSAPVAASLNSSTSLPRASLDAVYESHGVRPALSIRTRRRRFWSNSSSSPCRKELSHGVGRLMGVTVRASSADEPSGEKGQVKTEDVPAWAKPDSEELPPWAKNERPPSQEPAQDIPFPLYLIGSTLVSIAAVGSVFEYFNQNPVFGVVYPDNPFYTPILGFFAITGLPTAGFLFYKSIQLANKASEEADREDGYRR